MNVYLSPCSNPRGVTLASRAGPGILAAASRLWHLCDHNGVHPGAYRQVWQDMGETAAASLQWPGVLHRESPSPRQPPATRLQRHRLQLEWFVSTGRTPLQVTTGLCSCLAIGGAGEGVFAQGCVRRVSCSQTRGQPFCFVHQVKWLQPWMHVGTS